MKGRTAKASTSKNTDKKLAVKKKGKGEKDPNKPKRPPTAFFVFMEGFRKQYKEAHPKNKSVAVVGKAGGEKWKSLSDSEKAVFITKAEKLKAEYRKKIDAYEKGQNVEVMEEEESGKSNSEVNDGEDDGSEEEEEDD